MAELPQYRLGEMEAKLLTLHALHELGPCSNLQLIAFMAQTDLMNYFDLQSALYELAQRGQVLIERVPGDEVFTITPQGEEAITLFLGRLGQSALDKVQSAAPAFREQLKMHRQLYADISHEGRNEYHARMGIAEGGLNLMHLDLSLPTAQLADSFKQAWPQKARQIYDYIIQSLSGEELP